jgi:hypothetical protein
VAEYPDTPDEVLAVIDRSGISLEILDACARLIYEWELSGEPDARLVVIRMAKVLANASSSTHGSA